MGVYLWLLCMSTYGCLHMGVYLWALGVEHKGGLRTVGNGWQRSFFQRLGFMGVGGERKGGLRTVGSGWQRSF